MFQKVDKAHLAKQRSSKGAFSSTSYLRVKPTQMHPKVEQQKSKADQHEAIGRIGRSRPTQQFIAQPVARLDVAVATHKKIELVFQTQVFKLKRDMQKRSHDSASSSALRQNPVAEGIDETPAHSSTTVCGGHSPSRTSAAGDQDHSRTSGGKKCK